MSTSTAAELAPDERAVLEALEDADPTGTRRVELGEAVGEEYPEVELELLERGLIEKAGERRRRDGDEYVVYQLIALTERGERALARAREPEPEPEPLEPERRAAAPQPWREGPGESWLALSEGAVDRILGETQAIEYDDDAEAVCLELERDGQHATVELSTVQWLNSGRVVFFEEYHGAFGEPPGLDEREWGILQARLVDRYSA